MQIFYAPGINSDTFTLDEKESKHCIRVLRMTKGSPARLIDGRGNLYEATISDPDARRCVLSVSEVIPDFERRKYRLHIAISPLKNPERFEWFVEKSVEIGIDEITPVICKNTEKTQVKRERTEKIIISAMKQSLKAIKPVLNETISFDKFIMQRPGGRKMIAHCNSSLKRINISGICGRGENVTIMIGPEGDFAEDEIARAERNDFIPVHLGTSRLRTETAGIAACHSVYFINL